MEGVGADRRGSRSEAEGRRCRGTCGPMLVELDEREDYGEQRWIGLGFLRDIVVVVVFAQRRQDTIRIISVRKANKHERKRYEQALTN